MLTNELFPVLEFDDNPVAKLDPAKLATYFTDSLGADKLVITFFPEVVNALIESGEVEMARVVPGENPLELYRFLDQPDTLLNLGQVGCPACAGNLDLINAMGVDKVMFCGGGGVLDRSIDVGRLLLVEGAIRDEGFSYQYLPPSRVVEADPAVNERIARYLEDNGVPYIRGLTWTTDAIFRETADRIARRREEGAKIVEMEQAGCLAVAKFRGFAYGALIYGGDDVSGDEWSARSWRSRNGIRYDLVMLCKKLVCEL